MNYRNPKIRRAYEYYFKQLKSEHPRLFERYKYMI